MTTDLQVPPLDAFKLAPKSHMQQIRLSIFVSKFLGLFMSIIFLKKNHVRKGHCYNIESSIKNCKPRKIAATETIVSHVITFRYLEIIVTS